MPFGPGWRGRAPLTLSLFNTATGTGAPGILTLPASIAAGDLIVLVNSGRNNVGGAFAATPSGFTTIFDVITLNNCRVDAWYKIAAGTEGGTNPGGLNGGVENDRLAWVFRGNRAIQSVSVGSLHTEQTDSAPAGQTIAASGGVPPLVAIATYRTSGSVTTRGFSPAADSEITPSTRLFGKRKIYNGGQADISVSQTDDGISNTLCSFFISCLG
jgi:hypothetical protein